MASTKTPASLGLERRNPLPAGRYWIFRIGARQIVDFDAWLTRNRGKVKLRSHELDPSPPQTSFNVFEVLRDGEVLWDQFGLPDRAPGHVTSSQDVVRAPEIPTGLDAISQTARDVAATVTRGAENLPTLLFFAGVLYLLMNKGNDR